MKAMWLALKTHLNQAMLLVQICLLQVFPYNGIDNDLKDDLHIACVRCRSEVRIDVFSWIAIDTLKSLPHIGSSCIHVPIRSCGKNKETIEIIIL